tara:strand:+ start:115 stop:2013 length:1899 start_codon:yes stop_codon:yes gene_type:complete
MEKIEFELVADTKQSNKNIENVNKSIVDLNKNLETTGKDAEAGMDALSEGAKKADKSSFSLGKTLKTAFAIGGIVGIAVKIFNKFAEVLKENQNVANLFSIATEAISIVFTDLVNFLLNNIGAVKDFMNALFKDPLGTIKEFSLSIKQGIIDRFNQALEVLGFLGSAIKKVFSGDFSGAMEDVKMAGKQTVDVFTGVDDSFDQVAESVSNYTKEVIKTAAANVELANSAELAAAKNQGLLEQFDFENEKLRQIRDEERNSIEDRIKANNDLRDNLQKQQKLMLANAQISIDAANAQLAKDKDNVEFKKQLIEAENELAAVKATIAGFESEFKANDLALDKEKIELTNSKLESETNLAVEKKRLNAEQIEDDLLRLQEMQRIDAEEQELQMARLQRVIDEANAGTQAKVDAQIALDEFMAESERTNLERKTEIAEAEEALEEKKRKQKEETLDAIINIAGAESKLGKIAFVAKMALQLKEQIADAKALILKAKNAMIEAKIKAAGAGTEIAGSTAKAANTAPPPFNVPFILAAITTGIGIISTVKAAVNATKQATSKVGAPSGGGTDIPTPQAAVASAVATPPDLTSVGASGVNQIADAIGQQNQQPIQAFVVANDVTTAQSLDRNIVDGASL